jgi:hypothetical protein
VTSLLLSFSFLPVESCLPYKTRPSSILLLFLPLSSSPCDHQHQSAAAHLPPKSSPNRTTPLRFRWPRASSPPPLAPQPDSVQPRVASRRNRARPEPPLIGAARARPRHRQHAPPPLRPIQVWRSTPHLPLVLMRVLDPHVRRASTGNGVAPPLPPHLSIADHAPLLPVEHHHFQTVPWAL